MKNDNRPRKYVPSLLLFLLFEAVAVTLWLTKDNLFYLLNFSYIGGCLALGTALFTAGKRYARHFVQLAVGCYMLLYLGVISHENMQIEGFWYYLFLGVFEAATIHYAVAKIFGPLLFGRGWCGYACWTAMVLDFLPYKQPQKPRKEKLGVLRYVMFALSLALVSGLFLMKVANLEQIMFWLFLAGNALYYMWNCTTILLTEKRTKINHKGIIPLYIVIVKSVKSIYRYFGQCIIIILTTSLCEPQCHRYHQRECLRHSRTPADT